jgi:hypothetical protein
MAPDKVKAMQARPAIKGPADIRSYLGSCVWFSAFIPDYARIVTPLTNLTKKDTVWQWGAEREDAISLLILIITTAPTLKHFNVKLETEMPQHMQLGDGWAKDTKMDSTQYSFGAEK